MGAMYQGDDGWPTTAPVRSYSCGDTPSGLHDMAGNVREWTALMRFDRITRDPDRMKLVLDQGLPRSAVGLLPAHAGVVALRSTPYASRTPAWNRLSDGK